MSLEHITLLTHQCMINSQGSLPKLQVSRVFTGFSLDRNRCLNHCPLLPFSEVSGLSRYHVARSLNLLMMWLVFLAWPTPILNLTRVLHESLHLHNSGVIMGPPWITKIFLWLRKFQGIYSFLLGTRGKGQINSHYITVTYLFSQICTAIIL